MEELRNDVDKLIEILNVLTRAIVLGVANSKEEYLKEFTGLMLVVFPKIVECYARPEFEEVRSDMQYWTNQLQRMLDVLAQDDLFQIIDVLNFETKENLVLFRNMIADVED